MSKIVQILNNTVCWVTNHNSIAEITKLFPPQCVFVVAPDYVFKGWGYKTIDENGNVLSGNDRFIKPIPPDGYFYNETTGKIEDVSLYDNYLKDLKNEKQELNKKLFAEFLENNPLTWKDGKMYGVTFEDQSEISLNLTQYEMQVKAGIENPILEWHASKEKCVSWSVEDLTSLALAITAYIYPYFNKMNIYKEAIYSASNKEELDQIELKY